MSERHVSIGMTPTEDTTRIPMYLDVSRIVEAVSPHVTLTQTDDGVVITVEDIDGTKTATVYDGVQGETGPQGVPGQDGFSPSATVTQTATGATISITDAQGTTTADIENGQDGAPGQDGVSPDITVTDITGGHRVTITDAQETETFDVMDGADGDPGVGVPAGGTAGQVLSKASDTSYDTEWTTLNPVVTVTGSTPTITALPGVRYVCAEVVTTLDITLPASGIIDVVFACGSTPTVLTITPAAGKSVIWANGFDPSALEAWKVYEINIMDGLGVVGIWN